MLNTRFVTIKKPKISGSFSLTEVLLFFLAAVMVVPDGVSQVYPRIYKLVYVYGQYLALSIVLIAFLSYLLIYRHLSKTFFAFLLFMVSTVAIGAPHGSLNLWYNTFSACLCSVLLAETQSRSLDRLMLIFLRVLEFWIYVNLINMLLYPDGWYVSLSTGATQNWILGYKSSFQYYIFPALCFSWINSVYRGQKKRFYLLLAVSTFETFSARNAMLAVGLFLFILMVFSNLKEKKSLLNIWSYYIMIVAANLVFIFFLPWFTSSYVGHLFLLLTGKNDSLSNRASSLWPVTMRYIQNHPLWGNGILRSAERVYQYGGSPYAIHSHNQMLELLFIGGFFLLTIYIVLHIFLGRRLWENRNLFTSQAFSVSIFLLYIMVTVEVFLRRVAAPIWIMLFLSGMCREIHEQFKRRSDCVLIN